MAEEQLTFLIADLRRFTAGEVVALALDVQANLQVDTPRDTGWARANWVPSVGRPFDDPTIATVTSPTPAQVRARVAVQQAGVAAVGAYTDITQGVVFTTNNVPYIIPLNEGHSKKAGAGFVQRAVGRALNEREAA